MQYDNASKIHIFDCDGVVLNSNFLKVDAIKSALNQVGCPDSFINWAQKEFRENFGRTRAKHFETFMTYKGIPGYRLTKNLMLDAINIYSEHVKNLYCDCEVIRNTMDYIISISKKDKIYIVSASDEDELREILPNKISLFKKKNIYGGPRSKIQNIKTVLNKNNVSITSHVSFYGDAIQDAKASISTNINFFGLTKYSAAPKDLIKFCDKNSLKFFETCGDIKN